MKSKIHIEYEIDDGKEKTEHVEMETTNDNIIVLGKGEPKEYVSLDIKVSYLDDKP